MRRLIYFCPTFHPKPTGFAIAFTNIIKSIVEKSYFDEIVIFSTDHDVDLPCELKSKCRILSYSLRGRERISKMPVPLTRLVLPLLSKDFLSKVSDLKVTPDDVFMYEEFGMGFEMHILKKKFETSRHYLRVHGTFPEFTAKFSGLSHRRRYVDFAVESGEINIISTTNFYFDYLNQHFFKGSYDVQQRINYYLLPNLVLEEQDVIPPENEKITLIQLGRMDKLGVFQKGFFDTVRALRYVESLRPDLARKLRIIMIGDGNDADRVDKQLAMLKYVDVIRYQRCTNMEVKRNVSISDLVLMPSRCEGMSMFATEALALGKPLVFTAHNGLRDYLVDEYNGLRMEEFDYTGLAKNIIRYASGDVSLKEHGENAKMSAIQIREKTKACLDVLFS